LKDRLEKRLSPRRTAAVPAKILYGQGKIDCIIRNVSDTGAKLEVRAVSKVPPTFQLLVDGHEPQTCRVVWRSLREMGVAFADSSFGANVK
jgi:hypothetical protein